MLGVIDRACRSDAERAEQWDQALQAELEKLEPDEIIEWDHRFDRLAAEAYTIDLWGPPTSSTEAPPTTGSTTSGAG